MRKENLTQYQTDCFCSFFFEIRRHWLLRYGWFCGTGKEGAVLTSQCFERSLSLRCKQTQSVSRKKIVKLPHYKNWKIRWRGTISRHLHPTVWHPKFGVGQLDLLTSTKEFTTYIKVNTFVISLFSKSWYFIFDEFLRSNVMW